MISQSDVVHFLHKHVAELGPLADASLASLGLARKPVVCVPGEMSTVNAFASMVVRGGLSRRRVAAALLRGSFYRTRTLHACMMHA